MAQLAAREGRGVDPYSTRPDLDPGLAHVWQGFWQLSAGRMSGDLGVQPIRTEAIAAWLEIHGHRGLAERAELLELILALDADFMAWARGRAADAHSVPRAQR